MSSAVHDPAEEPRAGLRRRGLRRRRVGFVLAADSDGGRERTAVGWMSWFAEAGYDVTAIVTSSVPLTLPVPDGTEVRRLGRVRGHARRVRLLRRLVGEREFDAVVGVQTYPNLLTLAATRGGRPRPVVVLSEHDVIGLTLPGATMARRAHVRIARSVYHRADAVIAASHPVGAEIAAGFGVPASRCLVIPPPLLPAHPDVTAPRRPAPAPVDAIQLVIARGSEPERELELALRAAHVLSTRGVAVDVVALAADPLSDDARARAGELGVPLERRSSDGEWTTGLAARVVVLLASRGEGTGDALVDAAARGVPSVALSTALGVADALVPGVTGELAFDDHPDAIADAIQSAAMLDVPDVEPWLGRFRTPVSGALLERAIDDAASLRRDG